MSSEENIGMSASSISREIDNNPISWLQWRVVILCGLVAILDGFDTQAIAFVAPLLSEEFGIAKTEMGSIFSAALIGLMLGAFILSPIADRIGRKPVIILSCALMGVFCLMTATADSANELMLYRFLTGLGLGGAIPNLNTLTSEYAPKRSRAALMTFMFAGFPAGAVMGGILSVKLIEKYGWESVFIVGGIAPLILSAVLLFSLPESIKFLSTHRKKPKLQLAILKAITADNLKITSDNLEEVEPEINTNEGSVADLFRNGLLPMTVIIWLIFFCNLLMMYTLMSWLPSVMKEAGLPLDKAIITQVILNLGAIVGGIILSKFIDSFGAFIVLIPAFIIAGLSLASIGFMTSSMYALLIIVFITGGTVIGTQFGLNAFTVGVYPTSIRATGLGWALAVGRVGAIIGPVLTGVYLSLAWSIENIFIVTALPAIIIIISLVVLSQMRGKSP